jgi:hypothetical protein
MPDRRGLKGEVVESLRRQSSRPSPVSSARLDHGRLDVYPLRERHLLNGDPVKHRARCWIGNGAPINSHGEARCNARRAIIVDGVCFGLRHPLAGAAEDRRFAGRQPGT